MNLQDVTKSNIKIFARKAGFKLQDVALKIGMDKSEFSQRLSGVKQFRLKDLDEIAKVLGVSPHELLKPEE